ncbi:hypothetical protein BB561_003471 [Smittium simulii]|uniref:26S proteasome regulatory subunit RPN1 n=1 Tax=Smittium simulii TaxID=133385 RepID=A0A2T9YL82_9FUNG|nr:hypothetical protein BB561_003471 [Smittium simulii]
MADSDKKNIPNNTQSSQEDTLSSKTANAKLSKNAKEEISDEDQKLIDELSMLVERLVETDASLYEPALIQIRSMIKSSNSTMTSVPKPLKFLKKHHPTLQTLYSSWLDSNSKTLLADTLSLLGMVYDTEDQSNCLKYRIDAGISEDAIFNWGHEYIRHLAMQVGDQFNTNAYKAEDLYTITSILVKFFFQHNAESDAIDLLQSINSVELLVDYADKNSFERTCRYLIACSPLIAPPMNTIFLKVARTIYLKFGSSAQAMEVSLKIGTPELIEQVFNSTDDRLVKLQLAFILSQQQIYMPELAKGDLLILECMENSRLSERFIQVANQLNLMEPKLPEDIYKTNLEYTRLSAQNIDSAKHNLASTFVNAFVNAGFGVDKLMTTGEDGNAWVYKNRESGMLSASASLGMINLWDVEKGLTYIDKYLYASEPYIKAGALFGIGMLTVGVTDDSDTAKALLGESLEDPSQPIELKQAAIMSLGLAYSGTQREDIIELLTPYISDTEVSMDLACAAALSAGFVCIGSCNGDIASSILQAIMERPESDLDKQYSRFMIFGLGLLYFGRVEESDATIETLKVLDSHPIGEQASVLVQVCSYAGTGDVLQIQKLLEIAGAHPASEPDDQDLKDSDENMQTSQPKECLDQMFAVIGIAMIAIAEPLGLEMALRSFSHLMHYGEMSVKRAIPLAIGILYTSNPAVSVMETLSKYSHDSDTEVAINAILAMGYIGAGTNNARLAQMLRQLASYYYKQPDCLFMVRIAQGLVHMAKGTMTLSPLHFDRTIVSPLSLASLLVPIIASTAPKQGLLLGSSHYFLYYLSRAMAPRHMITMVLSSSNSEESVSNESVGDKLVPVSVSVRVGQSVDSVGQAGKPKTISGFQTHTTPVLLSNGERSELATDEYISLASTLERYVILRKNPDYTA